MMTAVHGAPGAIFPGYAAAPDGAGVVVRNAALGDVAQIAALINGFADRQLMLHKTTVQLARTFREFVVALDAGGRLLGCAALRVYTPQLAELASLAVDESAHGLGIGRKLVAAIEAEAVTHGSGRCSRSRSRTSSSTSRATARCPRRCSP
jgi:amino-acid N-acetyltransferase